MEQTPLVSIHLIVRNGEKYIYECLEHVRAQTYGNIEVRVFDNASEDKTADIARSLMPEAEIIRFPKNYILGGGFNRSLSWSKAPYVVGLSVDVMLAPDFVAGAVRRMESDKSIGVIQAKIMRYDYAAKKVTNMIDTTGIRIFRSRRIINRGHGEEDRGQYEKSEAIFCYEGAAPFFRRKALEAVKMKKSSCDEKFPYEYLDEDFVWYADEVDLGWRMLLLGWKSWYEPKVLAAHDRQTTKNLSKGMLGFVRERKLVPAYKRMLDYRNQRLAFLKNDSFSLYLRHLPFWLPREMMLFVYFLIFERTTLRAYKDILAMRSLMLKKRKEIMKRRVVSARVIARWFH